MKTIFKYTPDLSGKTILKTAAEQYDLFFKYGHPLFLIPDFSEDKVDIWLSFLDYIEKQIGQEVQDQDGGEIMEENIIDIETGLTECKYVAYNIITNNPPVNYTVQIKGYIVCTKEEESFEDVYFAATEVIII